MKKLPVIVALTAFTVALTVTLGAVTPYTTSFPLTENPISEGGLWTNGAAVGLDWSNIRTTPGFAFGTQPGPNGFNDSIAILKGTWSPDQSATATVRTVNQQTGGIYEEVEILLRFTVTAHSARGYEVNFRCAHDGSQYTEIVRWNGPLGNFTPINSISGPGLNNGDRVKASIVGNTITSYVNDVAIFSVTDSTITSGNPGMGFYLQGATGLAGDYGFTSFTATGGQAPPSAPTNVRIVGQ
jgi:hypothetical protein